MPSGRENPRFATWVDGPRALESAALLAASLRAFGGDCAGETLRVYVEPAWRKPEDLPTPPGCLLLPAPGAPAQAERLPFAGKAAAAARAEAEALEAGRAWLAWLDEDTVILEEPAAFRLPEGVELGWRPVMHRNIAPLASGPAGPYWERIWQLRELPPARHFPCVSVADGDTLRSYLNAGCLIVCPRAGLLQAWAEDFARAAADERLRELAAASPRLELFLHQAVLGATMAGELRDTQRELLPDSYNWPLLFRELFGGGRDFHNLDGVVSLRHEGLLLEPRVEWLERLGGDPARLDWLRGASARAWRLPVAP